MEYEYWRGNGMYQAAYERISKEIPDMGRAKTPLCELLRRLCHVYYRYYNDGDNYDELTDPYNGSITPFDEMDDGVPKKQALKVHSVLCLYFYDYKFALNLAVTYVLREIMISRSACTDGKIYNPLTGNLVLKSGRAGQQSIHLLYKKYDSKIFEKVFE